MYTNWKTATGTCSDERHYVTSPFRTRPIARGSVTCGLALLFVAVSTASGLDAKVSYPTMAPVEQYRMANRSEEIALARTAAPASISNDADVMVLGASGYETVVKGKNGFVCFVERSWAAYFDDPVFWNYKNRSPNCFNPAAVRSVLPALLERTQWVLAGVAKAEMETRTKTSAAANKGPEPGSLSYMLSKQGYLNDADGHWHPHLMFFMSRTTAASWGANLPGSPVFASEGGPNQTTTFYVPVAKWSDGTSDVKD
jgi:hypothetical protein